MAKTLEAPHLKSSPSISGGQSIETAMASVRPKYEVEDLDIPDIDETPDEPTPCYCSGCLEGFEDVSDEEVKVSYRICHNVVYVCKKCWKQLSTHERIQLGFAEAREGFE